ncbi:hypothetical protein [uncultured Tateyamaria sp.]|uniref:hypothetical protein n=1 Tax=uncultured Tateyamaria sp. TaxID=455651 RepID=UPI002613B72F|nr:hypothetical protein [uncultured Tateyamaria sp.]
MLGLAILSGAALAAVIGYHMVRPNYRDMRLSMAHLMPDPPESQAPKRKFSLRNLIASPRFWMRLICVALVALALFPLSFPKAGSRDTLDRHVRIVLDASGSMGVVTGGESRMQQGVAAAREVLDRMQGDARACVDMIVAGQSLRAVDVAGIGTEFSTLEPILQGQPVATLIGGLQEIGPCGATPTHAVVVTDVPEQLVPEAQFTGHLIWHQVGAPADNLALRDVTLSVGALHNRAPEITLRVASFGTAPSVVTVNALSPKGTQAEVALRRDEARTGGWIGSVPYEGAGTYRLELADGGALALDDIAELDVGALEQVTVDWRLSDLSQPRALVSGLAANGAIVIAPYSGSDMALPEAPFVLTYPGWPNAGSGTIGPFMRDHAVLRGVNFDVFEASPPRAIATPGGVRAVIRPDGAPGVWLAEKTGPRGMIVPHPDPQGTADERAMARLMFFNALSWVAQGATPTTPDMRYVTGDGAPVVDADAESDTARPLADPPTLELLDEPPLAVSETGAPARQARESWMPWLFALVLLVMLAERGLGMVWRSRDV